MERLFPHFDDVNSRYLTYSIWEPMQAKPCIPLKLECYPLHDGPKDGRNGMRRIRAACVHLVKTIYGLPTSFSYIISQMSINDGSGE